MGRSLESYSHLRACEPIPEKRPWLHLGARFSLARPKCVDLRAVLIGHNGPGAFKSNRLSDDVCFMASTLAHQTGFCYGMLKPLSMGMKVVYQDVWDASQMLDAVETEKIVWTLSATAFAMDMVAAQRRRIRDLSSFKFFICGGAAIPPKVVEEAREFLGAELIALWGMTENMVVTSTRPGDSVELVSNSDGTPVEWMEIRLMSDDGEVDAVGQAGNLQTRGASQALGYFHREDLYAAATPEKERKML